MSECYIWRAGEGGGGNAFETEEPIFQPREENLFGDIRNNTTIYKSFYCWCDKKKQTLELFVSYRVSCVKFCFIFRAEKIEKEICFSLDSALFTIDSTMIRSLKYE